MKQLWRILPEKELKLENQLIRLIEANRKILYHIARLYTRTDQQALEVVQNAVYKSYLSKRQLKRATNGKCWLIKKVIESAELYVQQILEEGDEGLEVEVRRFPKNDAAEELDRGIGKLPDKQRAALYMRYFEEMKPDEICEVLGISHSMLKMTLYKALTKLELELEEVRSYE